ncbi:MAG: hypothetical protein WBL58_05295, partial [Peptococcia bacterium]
MSEAPTSSSPSSNKSSTPPLGKDSTGLGNPYVKGSDNYKNLERLNQQKVLDDSGFITFTTSTGQTYILPKTTSTSLFDIDGGTDTLTIINKDTGEVVRQGTTGTGGRSGGGTGLPSITGGAKTQEEFETGLKEYIQKQPDVLPKTLTYQQEQILKTQLD